MLQALFVTFLWSTSWVLIKFGIKNSLPPLTFAGLRYTAAFLILIPFVLLRENNRKQLLVVTRKEWMKLILLGLVFYTLTQGTQFVSLAFLPASMVSLVLNLTPVIVAISGFAILNEKPRFLQWIGIAISAAGVLMYFLPFNVPAAQLAGIAAVALCLFSNTGSALLGRHINHTSKLSPLIITFISMGIGAIILLITGLLTQGIGHLSLSDWGIILWLALVNTSLAFVLWNKSLKVLTAVESSIINSFMLPQIALLAVVFLGEDLSFKEITGLLFVCLGVLLVQFRKKSN